MFSEAQNFSIVQTELDEVFYQYLNYDNSNPVMTTAADNDVFMQVTTDHAAYIDAIYKGVGLYQQVGETQTVPTSIPRVTNKVTNLIKDFALSVPLSKDLFDDNMHGVWQATVKDMALKARLTRDNTAFALFRGGFTTSLTPDGVSIFNSAHPLIGGGTQSNTNTGGGSALSSTSLNTAIIQLAQMKDQAGVVIGAMPNVLLVPPALVKLALELTQSALVGDASTNAINVYRSAYGFKVVSNPYLSLAAGGSDTAWFLLAAQHGFRRAIRQEVQTALRPWQYSDNRSYLYQANFRETYYCLDYVGAIGNVGA